MAWDRHPHINHNQPVCRPVNCLPEGPVKVLGSVKGIIDKVGLRMEIEIAMQPTLTESIRFTNDCNSCAPRNTPQFGKAQSLYLIRPEEGNMGSDRVKSTMTAERREHIMNLLRKNIAKIIVERRKEIDKDTKYAALCVLDAFQGRLSNGLAKNYNRDPTTFAIFSFQTSDWFLKFVVLTSIVHTSMIFVEPLGPTCSPYTPLVTAVHWAVFAVQLLDVLMKMYYEGIREYLDHDWQQLYATTVALHFFDLLWFGRTTLSNPLRPIVGLLRARSVRRFFTVVKSMVPSLTQTLAPLVAFLMLITVFCSLAFTNSIPNNRLDSLSYNWLWLVLTNDTFSRLFPTTLEDHAFYLVFFFAALYVGQRFILSVVLGHTFETFTAFTAKQVKKERLKEMQGLVKAFTALDHDKTGYISEQVWSALLRNLYPDMRPEEIALYYELVAAGDSRGIFIFQFLSLGDVLSFKFEKVVGVSLKDSSIYLYNLLGHYKDVHCPVPVGWNTRATAVLTWVRRYRILRYLNWIDIILLNLSWYDIPLVSLPHFEAVSLNGCNIITVLLVVEFLLKCLQSEGRFFKIGLNVLSNNYTFVFVVGTVGFVALDALGGVVRLLLPGWHTQLLLHHRVYLVRVLLRCCRCCRMFYINEDLAAFISALVGVGPVFVQNMLFAVIVAYIFAMVGNILFGAYCAAWATPLRAMVTVEKLFLPFDLLDVMEDVLHNVHPAAILYFLVYFLMSLIICNLSLSLVIELYSDILKAKDFDAVQEADKYDRLYQTIKSRAITRKVLAGVKSDFRNYRMVKSGRNDHRLKFVEGELGITEKDLKACKKYSNLDLGKLFDSYNKKLKDVTWEADFVRDLKNLKMGTVQLFSEGQCITSRGQKALRGYLLISGTVRVQNADGTPLLDVLMDPHNVFGGSFLCPGSVYAHTCVANGPVECIVIHQDELVEHSDHPVIGQLIRMCFKSSDAYTQLVEEKKSRRGAAPRRP